MEKFLMRLTTCNNAKDTVSFVETDSKVISYLLENKELLLVIQCNHKYILHNVDFLNHSGIDQNIFEDLQECSVLEEQLDVLLSCDNRCIVREEHFSYDGNWYEIEIFPYSNYIGLGDVYKDYIKAKTKLENIILHY